MKLLVALFFSILILNATEMGLKGGGCTLAQEGKVKVNYNAKFYNSVEYMAKAKSGKNFREIFVGTLIKTNNIEMKIIDYKPNKRMKGKPKTGVFIVETTINKTTEIITMAYIFDKGIISATGVIGKTTIGFNTDVKYSLCNVSIKK